MKLIFYTISDMAYLFGLLIRGIFPASRKKLNDEITKNLIGWQ